MHKGFLKAAAIFGMLSVALGAFGAHALKKELTESALSTFETGVRYQFYHVFALALTGIIYKFYPLKTIRLAGWFFIAGIFLFSFSLYFLSFLQTGDFEGFRWIGAITPFGGLSFIIGWILLLVTFFKNDNPSA